MTIPVILLGAGGHASVLLDILNDSQLSVLGYVGPSRSELIGDVEYLGDDEQVCKYAVDQVVLVNAVGDIGWRQAIYEHFKAQGYSFARVIHPSACISNRAVLAEGVQVMAGAVVQTGARLGNNVIINTRASVDHDCVIGGHSHIAVSATLAGDVCIGERVLVGAGSTVIEGINIGHDSIVGAGAVVINNVSPNQTVVGIPARPIKQEKSDE